jgi:hypothetical protein
MSRRQKNLFLAVAVLIALTRLCAVARSLFEWDEALFCLGVREYNVADHHPHPPGYPLFVAAAKLVHLTGAPEFRSLQAIVVLGAMFLFPALFFLARELGFDFTTSICGATLFAFLPNVWMHGGTGYSDVPAAAVGFAACALLLRGRVETRAYILGAAVLGIAAGFRPTNLLIGALPALIATYHRLRRKSFVAVAVAILLGAAIAGGAYLGAALATGSIDSYLAAVHGQSKWVHDVDSFHNPYRAPLGRVAKIFFLWPVQQRQQMVGLAILALVSFVHAIVRRRLAPLLTFAIFVPFAIVAWLELDVEAASRYAIPYMAVHALLAADGLGVITARRQGVQAAFCAVVVAVFAVWTWPALQRQRTSDSPPAAALKWVIERVPAGERVYLHGGIGPQAKALLGERPNTFFYDESGQIPLEGEAWILDLRVTRQGFNWVWPHDRVWRIMRRRNFEASISRASSLILFGDGWYGDEGTFRWMGAESLTKLPVLRGKGKLRLHVYVPLDGVGAPPTIEVLFNGATLERFVATTSDVDKSWIVPSRSGAPNELRIRTSGTVNPKARGASEDSRDLGLRVDALSWTPQN